MGDPKSKDLDIEHETHHSDGSSISSTSDHTIQELGAEQNAGTNSPTDPPAISRQISRISSRVSASYPPKVPRDKRRGLLARFAIVPEVTEPYLYPRKTKWMITFAIAIAAAAGPMGSAIVMPCLTQISKDFNVSPTITNLSVALYMLSMAIFPLWWSSFSETLGRRTIYLTSFILFTLFAILSAVANSIGMLIAMRVLSGGAAASVQAVGAGTIADIWEVRERGRAMGVFYLGPLCGPLLAPIIGYIVTALDIQTNHGSGGALAQGFNWRATQWFTAIYGGILIIFLIFALPETLRVRKSLVDSAVETENATLEGEVAITGEAGGEKVISEQTRPSATLQRTITRQSVAKRSRKTLVFLKRAFIDPLKIVLLLRFPAVAITVYYASITFGSLYFLNISIQETFSKPPYNFSVIIIGLCYIPGSLGYVVASLLGGRWLDYIMKREARKAGRYDESGRLIFRPEDRMRENAWASAFMFPCALIWYGWTAQEKVVWIVPLIANFFFGCGSMIVFAMATTMLTEFMPRRASTGIAVNNFVRNIFSAVGGIVASPIIGAIGNGWMCTILGLTAAISGCAVIWTMKKYGAKWREEMDKKLED